MLCNDPFKAPDIVLATMAQHCMSLRCRLGTGGCQSRGASPSASSSPLTNQKNAQDNMVRDLQRKLRGLQDACRDANTAARVSLGLSALEPSLEGSEGAANPYLQAHSDQLGSLVDLMTSKLKVPLFPQKTCSTCIHVLHVLQLLIVQGALKRSNRA